MENAKLIQIIWHLLTTKHSSTYTNKLTHMLLFFNFTELHKTHVCDPNVKEMNSTFKKLKEKNDKPFIWRYIAIDSSTEKSFLKTVPFYYYSLLNMKAVFHM